MELLDQLRTAYGQYLVTDAVCETGSLGKNPCIRFSFPNVASSAAGPRKASAKEVTLDEFAFFTEVSPKNELHVDHVRLALQKGHRQRRSACQPLPVVLQLRHRS